ncbi:MAG: type II/IV secretion system ATPase subunit [Candidatus Aenigmarchaeota archaeon]|nr:type II/IV secretion system ATPase subunit [Candidatus Aenigmarchaeota archaeon]
MVDIRKYRGMLWRKMHEKKAAEAVLPGFRVDVPSNFIQIPKVNKISDIDVRYPLIPPFAYAHIKWDPTIQQVVYSLEEPILSEEEKKMYKKSCSSLVDMIQVGLTSIKENTEAIKYLEIQIKKVFKHLGVSLTSDQYTRLMYYIYRDFVGLNQIEPLLRDPMIEDIGCDGVGIPLFVVHRRYGSIKSDIIFHDLGELREFVIKIAERSGRYVSYAEPILDATLPDGSRVNASLAGDVTTRGPTFSIRKFTERPYSPVELMELGSCNAQIMAYFWFLMETGVSMLIAGGVATGKTTFLNSICMFIPPEAKIVSIEDTRELKLSHDHWIPAVSRLGFGIPLASGEKYGEVTLFDLLKGSFRQNPDYVIVGEVRGKEAYVMFQGMSSGHPSIATFHAGSVDTVIKRLTTAPIDLSASLVESLDVIVIMIHAREKGKSARRIKEIEEIESIDSNTLKATTRKVIEWDPAADTYIYNPDSILLRKIAHNKGITFEDALKEVEKRKIILQWLAKSGKKDFKEVTAIINEFYKNPKSILDQVGKIEIDISKGKVVEKINGGTVTENPQETEKKEVKEEKPQTLEKEERVDLIKLFGFKVVENRRRSLISA